MSALLEAALDYARRGWRVFPLTPGGKTPLARLAPNGCHSATTAEVVIRAWWQDAPDANVGVATGEGSGLLVLDVDSEAIENDTLSDLMAEHGALPFTPTVVTGGGGAHHYLAYPKTGRYGNTAGKIGKGIDTRGEGGYVVAPPSVTDARYQWAEDPDFCDPAEPPVWLLDLLADKPAERPAVTVLRRPGVGYGQAALDAEMDELMRAASGTRNNRLNKAAFSLGQLVAGGALDHGTVEAVLVEGGVTIGLARSEATATVRSGMGAGARSPRSAPELEVEQPFDRKPAASNGPDFASDAVQGVSRVSDDVASADGPPGASTEQAFSSDGLVSLAEALDGYVEAAEKARQGGTGGVPTGFADLDRLTGGLKGGELVILAARPGQGKTALALNLARHAAGQGVGVLVVSAEMSAHQLAERLLAGEARVDAKRLREGYVDAAEHARVGEAFAVLRELPVWILDESRPSLAAVVKTAGRAVAERGVGLVVVDYVGLIRVPGERDPRLQVKAISAEMKALARDFAVPVLALSQLNRGVEGRDNHTPRLSDLRESGDLEQDADIVLFVSREEMFDPESDRKGIADLTVAKNRSGPTGSASLRWIAPEVRFTDLEVYRTPDYGTGGSF